MNHSGHAGSGAGAAAVRAAFREAIGLLLPVACVACGEPDSALCPACVSRIGEPPVVPDIVDAFPVWAGAEYDGVVRRAILALKNDQRTDVAVALSHVFRRALDAALAELPQRVGTVTDLRLATLPSSRAAYRRRGYRPVDRVLRKGGLAAEHPLRLVRQPHDQVGLGRAGRQRNLGGSLLASERVAGGSFLVVDDVVTTGATLREARRALDSAGARTVGAVVIAATPLRILATRQPHSLPSDFLPGAD
ncbi:ComF family protein [Mycetocola zhujimingii]|uniref:ComF family protein n=1 Tax=Mycetocola zhujimingii TaxID=2079792 RepID=UPI000D34DBD5|nr:phosphoribosyltransferase family protein [Mycetocola zhujimingii]AWB85827.1 phosphoribosyltransferase [Mycetocola zhujimingii]